MLSPQAMLFIDRDGTLIEEPPDEQVDSLEKVKFLPGVFAALAALREHGYHLAMVTNQDGLGTPSFPQASFELPQRFVIDTFASQGVHFDAVFVCPHLPRDSCECRKPRTALVDAYLRERPIDLAASAVIGDRESDLEFAANLGVRGLRVRVDGSADETWPAIVRELTARRARVERSTRETTISVAVDLDATGPVRALTGIGFFDHMLEQIAKHGGFSLELECQGDLHVDEHHTIEDCALALGAVLRQALGDKRGIGRYGFLLPMDEARAQVAIDLSGRAYAVFEGRFGRDQVGGLPSELVPHFFRSLADSLGASIHVSVTGENTHHMIEACFKGVGRALRQALRREGADLPSTKGVL
ncbi:MAG TPA: bifunctional histidinol-phosphatase/imidazoleglycerol-phosphate dehydratase HisB [Steroidobacteraceae bacterium]|nr:bifunctional histidinol-phosphatase/imidazoleglycerol-phosphate dehydratase HisB [Steroidobacteraceae bacterium]HNS28018.1 bifunctional histidinol-phosphatase/imidazoleglycerol-phosphate dehydratase HisB [Steroidobacteraceae bacterium]